MKRRKIKKCDKEIIIKKTESHCFYCWRSLTIDIEKVSKHIRFMTVDHKIPLIRGGTNDIENLVPACDQCNQLKGRRKVSELKIKRTRKIANERRRIYFN